MTQRRLTMWDVFVDEALLLFLIRAEMMREKLQGDEAVELGVLSFLPREIIL